MTWKITWFTNQKLLDPMVVGVGLPRWWSSIESACQCKRHGLRRSLGEGSGNPFPCLENPINREAWLATVCCIVRVGYDRAAEHARMQFISVQSLSCVRLFATPWTAARQASLSITNSRSLRKLMSTELVMPSNHLILCRPLLLNLPQSSTASGSFPMSQFFTSGGQSIGVSASTSVLPMNTQDWSPLGWTGWISLQSKGLSESSPTPQFRSINTLALSFLYSPTLTSIHDHWKNHSHD